jgi:hypothetical protein
MRPIPTLFLALAFTALSSTIAAANDFRVNYLEQEVRELKRQVLSLTQRIDQATTRPDRQPAAIPGGVLSTRPAPDTQLQWVDARKWKSLRPGMTELEVIETLGRPSSTREDGGARVVLYAIEIGAAGFLGGSVRFRDGAVVEINEPRLQ